MGVILKIFLHFKNYDLVHLANFQSPPLFYFILFFYLMSMVYTQQISIYLGNNYQSEYEGFIKLLYKYLLFSVSIKLKNCNTFQIKYSFDVHIYLNTHK